ncbi:RNA-binding protein 12B [Varanus komodoensis]|uniref:RNA binding motif protein 12B n=1 Tax=Varanus komodoensis TaxID=61221 RepID=A0A8D2KYX9_VARKO|nr:RNA-binding protein 12B [Varanus komodoensis]
MAVVIRLQGLPVVAGSADIRRFFSGLNIPDGGVHIIGGEKGEAFIIFSTDEDARQAMSYSGGYIKNSRIEFFLSSKTEMQNIIEINRKRFDRGGRETLTGSRRIASSNSGASGVGNLSNLVAAIKKGISKSRYDSMDPVERDFHSNGSRHSNMDVSKSNYNQPRGESDNVYVFIRGMPYSSTEDDVFTFFSGLQVEEVILLQSNGRNNGDGVVKFATSNDARKGLQRNREYMGARFIEVHPSNEGTWIKYGGRLHEKMDYSFNTEHFDHKLNKEFYSSSREHSRRESSYSSSRKRTRSRSPPRRIMSHTHSQSPTRRVMSRTHSRSPPRRVTSRTHSRSPLRRVTTRTHLRSPPRRVKTRSRSPFCESNRSYSPHNREYYIHIKNLSAAVEKRDLMVFFGDSNVTSNQITFLKPHDNETRNKDAVVMFKSEKAYQAALSLHKHGLFGRQVHIFPISKTTVYQLTGSSVTKRSPERHHHVKEKSNRDGYSVSKTCVYVRNFPFDVTNVEVQKFFAGFNIDDRNIYLLYDDKGIGLGEALVKFRSEDEARKAESLNRRRFLGTEVLLRCIPEEQMQEFGINVSLMSDEKMQSHLHAYEKDEHFYSAGSPEPSTQSNLKHDYRCPSDEFIYSPDNFRGPPPFTEFGEGIPGSFPDRHFMSDSNFRGGSDHVTLIKLKNIPFRASPNEILDFFHGYKIIPESLSVNENEYGMSSGEAVIALINYNEAVAAVNELNDRPIGQRKVRLSLV